MKKTKDILWGGATASSQYEGGYKEGGKGLDTQDCRPYLKRTSDATTSTRLLTQDIIDEAKKCEGIGHYPFRQGSDGYHHIDEDIALLKELGIDIYRFSISWARLILMEMKKHLMKRELSSMIISSKKYIKQV